MPNPPPQPQLPRQVGGPVDRVPCPHCGKPNNFNGHHEMLDVGHVFQCDHCKRSMQIAGVRQVKFVYVRAPQGHVTQIKKR